MKKQQKFYQEINSFAKEKQSNFILEGGDRVSEKISIVVKYRCFFILSAAVFIFLSGGLGSILISCWLAFSLSTLFAAVVDGIFSLIGFFVGFLCVYAYIRKDVEIKPSVAKATVEGMPPSVVTTKKHKTI